MYIATILLSTFISTFAMSISPQNSLKFFNTIGDIDTLLNHIEYNIKYECNPSLLSPPDSIQ